MGMNNNSNNSANRHLVWSRDPDTHSLPPFQVVDYCDEHSPAPSLINRGGYAIVALTAYLAGRPGVANLLLIKEISIPEKVYALMIMGLYSDAAAVAIKAQDADLLVMCLMELEIHCLSSDSNKSRALSRFWNIVVSKFPAEGKNLLQLYYVTSRTKNIDTNKNQELNLLLRAQDYSMAGSILTRWALDNTMSEEEERMLLKEASRVFGLGRDGIFEKTCIDEFLELRVEQERLRKEFRAEILLNENKSVISTLHGIYSYAAHNPRNAQRVLAEGDKFVRKFKISEKRMWHVKIKAFATSHQWSNLRALADSRTKPPVGFMHFALAAVHGKQGVGEILHYVEKMTNGDERYDVFCEAALWKWALDEARKLEDSRRKIMYVRSRCNDLEVRQLCEDLLNK